MSRTAASAARRRLRLRAPIFILEVVAVGDLGVPRQRIGMEPRLRRQRIRLAVVLAVLPRRMLLDLEPAGEHEQYPQGDEDPHVGNCPGSFWYSPGFWFTRGPSPSFWT